MATNNECILSVRLMTYNHEKFISQAIDSILEQKTDFQFEIVIGDDFSTDNTKNIIEKYKSTEKIKINFLQRKQGDNYWLERQKKGRLYNFINIIENCKGKYIALCDGDDYWTDPLKLQKQVDFLEANEDFIISFHEAEVIDTNCLFLESYNNVDINKEFALKDLIEKNFITTASVVFRNKIKLPKIFMKLSAGDWGLNIYYAQYGKIHYMSESMSAYRIHQGGIWSKMSNNEMVLKGVEVMKQLDEMLNYEYHNEFKGAISKRLSRLQQEEKSSYFSKLRKKLGIRTRIKVLLNIK